MPDIPEYIKLQKERLELKHKLALAIGRELDDLIREFGRFTDKVFQQKGNTLELITSADFKDAVEKFVKELMIKSDHQLNTSRAALIDLQDRIKKLLDFNYPIDYQLFPKTIIPTKPVIGEITKILTRYRDGKFTTATTRRLIKKRFAVPVHYADALINTQLAGFDNSAAQTIADLAGLKKAIYFGPIGQNTRPFCLHLLQKGGTYTEKEIRAMNNGQGLPVLRYCGGYRCMHEWLWVNPEWEETKSLISKQ